MKFYCNLLKVIGLLSFIFAEKVSADGLSDLQQALLKLNGSEPVSGLLNVSFAETRGEGKDIKLKIAQENRLKLNDEEADTPVLNGAEILSASSLIPILSSAQTILDYIKQGEFKGESFVTYMDKQVRILDFALPLESFIDDKKTRGYVNKFQGSYQVLIDDDGTPLETRRSYSGKGSAYIFFSMTAESQITSQFQIQGTRLVRINKTVESNSSSTFNDRTYTGRWQLAIH